MKERHEFLKIMSEKLKGQNKLSLLGKKKILKQPNNISY